MKEKGYLRNLGVKELIRNRMFAYYLSIPILFPISCYCFSPGTPTNAYLILQEEERLQELSLQRSQVHHQRLQDTQRFQDTQSINLQGIIQEFEEAYDRSGIYLGRKFSFNIDGKMFVGVIGNYAPLNISSIETEIENNKPVTLDGRFVNDKIFLINTLTIAGTEYKVSGAMQERKE